MSKENINIEAIKLTKDSFSKGFFKNTINDFKDKDRYINFLDEADIENKMDFKARFEGRQSFINKRGDLVDKSSCNVEPLMMPLQSPSKDSR